MIDLYEFFKRENISTIGKFRFFGWTFQNIFYSRNIFNQHLSHLQPCHHQDYRRLWKKWIPGYYTPPALPRKVIRLSNSLMLHHSWGIWKDFTCISFLTQGEYRGAPWSLNDTLNTRNSTICHFSEWRVKGVKDISLFKIR